MVNLIIDTDIGDDPDDILVLYIVLLHPELFNLIALISGDEVNKNYRAKLLSLVLLEFGRTDIPIFIGRDFGSNKFLFNETEINSAENKYLKEFSSGDIVKRCQNIEDDIYYLCIQGQTNLARIIQEAPFFIKKLKVFQMGGAIKFRDPEKAEHNFRIDPKSVSIVLKSDVNIKLILSDTTFQLNKFVINKDSGIYERISDKKGDRYGLLFKNLNRFFIRRYSESVMSDVITLLSLCYPEFLKFSRVSFLIDEKGIMHINDKGKAFLVSEKSYDESFIYQKIIKLLNL